MDKQELITLREYEVVKSNELIQRTRYTFTPQQQKALLYAISQLKPDQKEFEYQLFDIGEFCEICGIDRYSGTNHKDLKDALQGLRDKSMWVTTPDGCETLLAWFSNVKIQSKTGKVGIRFDEEMKPYLLDLKGRYTKYKLIYTLGMKSKYSIRLYELLKSLDHCKDVISFDLDYFKERMGAEYTRWVDVRRFVVEPALKEINELTDLNINFDVIKKGRAVHKIKFTIAQKKDFIEQIQTRANIEKRLNKGDCYV